MARIGKNLTLFFATLAFVIVAPALSARAADSTGKLGYNRDIRPILSDNCFACHGPDKNKRKAKMRLDDRASVLEKEALVPGKPDDSELVKRIFSNKEKEMMPPPESHKKPGFFRRLGNLFKRS